MEDKYHETIIAINTHLYRILIVLVIILFVLIAIARKIGAF